MALCLVFDNLDESLSRRPLKTTDELDRVKLGDFLVRHFMALSDYSQAAYIRKTNNPPLQFQYFLKGTLLREEEAR